MARLALCPVHDLMGLSYLAVHLRISHRYYHGRGEPHVLLHSPHLPPLPTPNFVFIYFLIILCSDGGGGGGARARRGGAGRGAGRGEAERCGGSQSERRAPKVSFYGEAAAAAAL